MAFIKLSLLFCVAAVYFATVTLSVPQGSGLSNILPGLSGIPSLQDFPGLQIVQCLRNATNTECLKKISPTALKNLCAGNSSAGIGKPVFCLTCKPLDRSCFTDGSNSTSTGDSGSTST